MPEAARAMNTGTAPLLALRGLQGWYGESHVLHGIDLDVRAGEVVTLLGRNGAGKTTTLRAIIGILGKRAGSITYDGVETIGMPSRSIARLGLGYVPEERGIFASLTVQENLMLPPRVKPGGMSVAEILPQGIGRRAHDGTFQSRAFWSGSINWAWPPSSHCVTIAQ